MRRLTLYRPETEGYDEALSMMRKSEFRFEEAVEPENGPLYAEDEPLLGVYIESIDQEIHHIGLEQIEDALDNLEIPMDDETGESLKSGPKTPP